MIVLIANKILCCSFDTRSFVGIGDVIYVEVVGARMCTLCFVPKFRDDKQREIATLPVQFYDVHHAIGIFSLSLFSLFSRCLLPTLLANSFLAVLFATILQHSHVIRFHGYLLPHKFRLSNISPLNTISGFRDIDQIDHFSPPSSYSWKPRRIWPKVK